MDIKIFDWSRGVTKTFSINPATKNLIKFLQKIQPSYDEIILFGKSFGGLIAEKAIKKNDSQKIHLIYITTPHKHNKINLPPTLSVINIYSDQDKFQKISLKLLYFCFGSQILKNTKNISLTNIKHSDFNKNINIYYKGNKIKLFDFYTKIILSKK